jgi:hypothetical protein
MELLLARRTEEVNVEARKNEGRYKAIKRKHKRPFAGPSERTEALWNKDKSLPNIIIRLRNKSKAGPEGTKAVVATSEGSSNKMEATNLEANSERTEAVV